ncbi:hypothetical protein [Pseudoalteromonas rubra]|uniref:hypothetical protein n=1 Tax=Pseudoalteromonas rubra TaxID=43658 RepID=UPI002DBB3B6B|nr:hypothetical protein [Pseudoalteromonas rubra]MEC4090899.1 hypothetical protein [Pseudoalteromonas rubra]
MENMNTVSENCSQFTQKQKLQILISIIKESFLGLLSSDNESEKFASKTRGNVNQRLGGSLNSEEHDQYVQSALEKVKNI